ncbi:MAG: ribulose-phosphate 3-epimerase [Bacteroidales bacterium]|nr:ribulose-phosphate 3-epimerase [Bacteroidales bacterium]
MPIIAPSILTADFLRLGDEIKMLNESKADWIHLDIMDGVYVPNISFGFAVIKKIKSIARKPLDAHLMIVNPDIYLSDFRDAGVDRLTVHLETCVHLDRTVSEISRLGMKPGLALNPHTSLDGLEYILPQLSMVLIMTVNPGFGGQKFIPYSFDKVRKLKKMIVASGSNTLIQVDGGVSKSNIKALVDAGVDVFVVGNTVFSAPNPSEMISDLRDLKNLA